VRTFGSPIARVVFSVARESVSFVPTLSIIAPTFFVPSHACQRNVVAMVSCTPAEAHNLALIPAFFVALAFAHDARFLAKQ
jgi:hypothetical protein